MGESRDIKIIDSLASKEDRAKTLAGPGGIRWWEPRIGLALSGGAVRGIAHLGVLKAFQESNIHISYLAGTSSGAFIAALFAKGVSVDDIYSTLEGLSWRDVSSFRFSRMGFFSNAVLGDLIREHCGEGYRFEDARVPLAMISTDINTGEKVIHDKGDVALAVQASTCIPGFYIPIPMGDRLLVDGGLVENIPVSPLRKMGAEMVVAVDICSKKKVLKPDGVLDVMVNSFDIAVDASSQIHLKNADVRVDLELADYSKTNTAQMKEIFDEGYRKGRIAVKEVKRSSKVHFQYYLYKRSLNWLGRKVGFN